MKECIIFPRDPDTLGIIKEIEAILNLPHRNSNDMSSWKFVEYINWLTLQTINFNDDSKKGIRNKALKIKNF